jgi:PqqD family protein of HPr-rel-A system
MMWRLVPGQSLNCREWDGEVVLYNDVSGSTHLLDGAALDVLQALRAGPLDAAGLATRLLDYLDADDGGLIPLIDDMLASLARLDLVEPC